MLYATVMFVSIVIGCAVVANTWIAHRWPAPQPELKSCDGYALCPGCRHPLVASHVTRRVITTEEYL